MGEKLKILCLHGYTQNGVMFRNKMSVVRKDLETLAEFVYITAPHHISPPTFTGEEDNDMSEEHKPFGWWYSPTYKPVKDGYFVGYKESVEYIKNVLNEQGPFDGILGFSQGACFAALLTELLETRDPDFNHPPFKLAILVSGFKPIVQEATNSMLTKEHKLKTPSLHYIGDFDTLVLPKTMLALTEAFENPVVFRHSGGHYLPSTPTSKKAFIQFLDTIKAGTLSPSPDRATVRLESE